MKAIVCTQYGPPDVLQLREVPKPVPRNNEVSIKIHAISATFSDCRIRRIEPRPRRAIGVLMVLGKGLMIGFGKPRQPILGTVLAGEVESAGMAVTRFKQGDRVFGWANFPAMGAYAEFICLPQKAMLTPMPGNVDYEGAAAIPYGGMLALHHLKKAAVQNGQKVLIYGASGAIGTSAVQIAKAFGAHVTGVCSTANLEFVKSLGADAMIDYTQQDSTNGEHYDFIFDTAGIRKTSTFKSQLKTALTPGGKYDSVDNGLPLPRAENMSFLKELVEAGKLKPVIGHRYPLEEMVEAHRTIETGHKKGNVIVTVAHDS